MSKDDKKLTVVLASGGTGGHIFPAEALAAELISKGNTAILITDKRYKKHSLTPTDMDVKVVSSSSLGSGLAGKLLAASTIYKGIMQAKAELKKINPDVVIGFGGYPSFPTMMAAVILKIPTIIHEQNSVLGRVNKVVSGFVSIIATSFREVKGIKRKHYDKVVLTGNPVRPAIRALREFPYPGVDDSEHIHILVTGGSQGATTFSDVVPEAILSLPNELRKLVRIDQQCREEDIKKVRQIYDEADVNADLATFFQDIPSRLASAHLVIARAGASTISEITVAGRPSILVPYPLATDGHQMVNAMSLEKRDAAVVIDQKDFTAKKLTKILKSFLENPDSLKKMAVSASEMGKDNAVEKLMQCVVKAA